MVTRFYFVLVLLVFASLSLYGMYRKGYMNGYRDHTTEIATATKTAMEATIALTNELTTLQEQVNQRKDSDNADCVTFRRFNYYDNCVRPAH